MEREERRCLICQAPLPSNRVAYCCKEHQREAHRRKVDYFRRYGYPPKEVRRGLETRVHPRGELLIGGAGT